MAQSPIQPKKRGNKKSSQDGGWGKGVGQNLRKEGVGNIGE